MLASSLGCLSWPTVGFSTCLPREGCLPQRAVVPSAQSMMGTRVMDPALPVHLENSNSSFKAHFRWHFLPELSHIQAARTNSPRPRTALTSDSRSQCVSASHLARGVLRAGPGELRAGLAGGPWGRGQGRALRPLCGLSREVGDVSPGRRS